MVIHNKNSIAQSILSHIQLTFSRWPEYVSMVNSEFSNFLRKNRGNCSVSKVGAFFLTTRYIGVVFFLKQNVAMKYHNYKNVADDIINHT